MHVVGFVDFFIAFYFLFGIFSHIVITKTGGKVLQNWALHRCGENVTIEKLTKTLIEGTSENFILKTSVTCVQVINKP